MFEILTKLSEEHFCFFVQGTVTWPKILFPNIFSFSSIKFFFNLEGEKALGNYKGILKGRSRIKVLAFWVKWHIR